MAQIVLSPKNGNGRYAVNVTVNYTETNVNTSNNTSDVYFEVILSRNSWSTSWTSYGQKIYVDVNINGVNNRVYVPQYNYNGQSLPGSVFGSGTVAGIVHDDNGSKTISISASITDNSGVGYTSGSASGSSTMALTNIPRYANITNYRIDSRTETTITHSITVDADCSDTYYKIALVQPDGTYVYGEWISMGSCNANATKTNTITGLTAGASYVIGWKCKRADSGLEREAGGAIQVATYNYPSLRYTEDFTIGEAFSLTIYNKLNRTAVVYAINPLGNEKLIGTTTTTDIIFSTTSNEWKEFLYNGIPNSSSGTYQIRVVCNETNTDITKAGGTYNIDLNINKPTFENFTSQYTANLTNLTNNNQTVINNLSTITYNINTGATAKNGSTISKYVVTWGSATPQTITDISNSVNLANGNGDTIQVTAYDSRNLSNTYNVPISELVAYTVPANLNIKLHRRNGVETTSYMDLTGTIYYDKFGTDGVSNLITSIKYIVNSGQTQYTISDISGITYSSQSATNHTQTFTIKNMPINENGTSGGFDVDNSFIITAIVTDTSGSSTNITGTLKDGKFAEDWYCDDNNEYHCGINGLANASYALFVNGGIMSSNFVQMYLDSNNILYITDDGSNPNPNESS